MQLPVDDITALIPQKHPFVMVGRLLHVDDELIRSSFVISPDNMMVSNGHFTEGGLIENIAQTAALRAGYVASVNGTPVKNGYIGSVKDLEILALPKVNDELITEIRVDSQIGNMTILTGQVWSGTELIAKCDMRVLEEEESV
ncbi:3-hydroxyacyl-ACP dehydratase [Mucilaginibacter daejeonensis]|uniref:3-hydroxyacyl-ACP dehydratase n=1 Tax=Mucilaginibacter daejeonensis TaxID=398049 RepID=UPI001D175376|nr:3-hydroxyacyl-ACP dehydratase [Mucilaginibacter daejeonensis]UEG52766.1 3-hydroxyacyl-ACP dehydratase [Mucilaginibacter daejeonensis]